MKISIKSSSRPSPVRAERIKWSNHHAKQKDQDNFSPCNFDPKRLLDVFLAAGLLVVISPLFLLLVFVVKTTSPGPVFFVGERIGRAGKPFRMIKFRTMLGNAEKLGPTVTAEGDPRVTPIGRILRRTKFDELPTLVNVLRGDMSIVGPRPETAPWINLYTPQERSVLLVRPGITSLATILYRHEEKLLAGKKIQEAYPPIMREKLRIELGYLRNRSVLTDLRIIALTVLAIFRKHSPKPESRLSPSLFSKVSKVSCEKLPTMNRSQK